MPFNNFRVDGLPSSLFFVRVKRDCFSHILFFPNLIRVEQVPFPNEKKGVWYVFSLFHRVETDCFPFLEKKGFHFILPILWFSTMIHFFRAKCTAISYFLLRLVSGDFCLHSRLDYGDFVQFIWAFERRIDFSPWRKNDFFLRRLCTAIWYFFPPC